MNHLSFVYNIDSKGTLVGGFASQIGMSNSMNAELIVVMFAIEISHARGWINLSLVIFHKCNSIGGTLYYIFS
jgi:hypothetical protein